MRKGNFSYLYENDGLAQALLSLLGGGDDSPTRVLPDTAEEQGYNDLRQKQYPSGAASGVFGYGGYGPNDIARWVRDEYEVPATMQEYRRGSGRLLPDAASRMFENRVDRFAAGERREQARDRIGPAPDPLEAAAQRRARARR